MIENEDELDNIELIPDDETSAAAEEEEITLLDQEGESEETASVDEVFANMETAEETIDSELGNDGLVQTPDYTDFGEDNTADAPTFDLNEQKPATDGTVTVQPVKFASFDENQSVLGDANKNLDNLLDIELQLTVELGRTSLPVKKVLELTRGSIIELEKIAGEPVELYANEKLIAHGEVVVIEDHFGLRITSMSEPDIRLNGLH